MLCQKCQQIEATVHLTHLQACRQVDRHYCEPCSRTVDFGSPMAVKPQAPPPAAAGTKEPG